MIPIFILLLTVAITIYFLWPSNRKIDSGVIFNSDTEAILQKKIPFYRNLDDQHKVIFRNRLQDFLNKYPIHGIESEVTSELKLLIACSAVTPVFYFPNWNYFNLSEIMVYENLVETYEIKENKQTNVILGQVRPFQTKHIVLLSKQSILKTYAPSDRGMENLGIHEFIHLVDEADGVIDGMPKAILPNELVKPWAHLIYKEIEKMKRGNSDINPYGITNHGEFFAVVSEYFFENPAKFKDKHPELYAILKKVFTKK